MTSSEHDPAGLVTAVTYPSGARVAIARDADGQPSSVTLTADGATRTLASGIQYAPFGPLSQLTWGDGSVLTRQFDAAGRLTEQQTDGFQHLAWTYTADGNITALDDLLTSSRSQSFAYDAVHRLTSAAGAYGSLGYAYDPVGNRTRLAEDGNATDYTYAADSNRLLQAGADSYAYDAMGNATQAGGRSFTYDTRGRMSAVDPGQGQPVTYRVNALGQRSVKTDKKDRLFAYDSEGHLIGEYDDKGSPIREYVYLGDRPLAMVVAGRKGTGVYFIHTDHLGTPKLLTDDSGKVVWQGQYRPFGEVTTSGKVEQPLRFPGQYFDAESGLHYNYYRDYHPGIGRYVESDPIGLDGGINPYLYVAGNPLGLVDVLGLRWVFRGWSAEMAPWYMYWWTDYVNVNAVCIDDCTRRIKEVHAKTFQTRPMCINEVCPGSPNDPRPDSPFRSEVVDDAFDLGEAMARAWDCGSLTGFQCFIATAPPGLGQKFCDTLN